MKDGDCKFEGYVYSSSFRIESRRETEYPSPLIIGSIRLNHNQSGAASTVTIRSGCDACGNGV